MRYTLSYKTKFGTLTAESNNPDDLLIGYETLKSLVRRLAYSTREKTRETKKRSASRVSQRIASKRQNRGLRGRGETAKIIRELELKVLPTSFFSRARTTGETKEKLIEISGRKFTSRKVSQALGILWKKGELRRTGTRNYFAYSK